MYNHSVQYEDHILFISIVILGFNFSAYRWRLVVKA